MRFGKPVKNKRRNNPRYFTLTEGIKFENNSNRNMHDVQFYLEEFYPFCKQALGFEKDATVIFESDFKNANNPLGKTAYYDPASNSISVYVDKRHPKDIMRSVAHELVHHHQNLRGDLDGASMEEGYAQNDDHLREMEREAYEKGNMLFRDWEDHKKNNNGDESLMARIMEKWGYDAAALYEDSQTFEKGELVKVVASALAVDGEKTGTVVSFEDPAVTIKLDDDQEGKHVPKNKMVKVKKDYVEPRAEAGFAPEMGAAEDETLDEDVYDDDDFDMGALEQEFPWLAQDVSSGNVPPELAAELAAEFGDKPAPEEEDDEGVSEAQRGGVEEAYYGSIPGEPETPAGYGGALDAAKVQQHLSDEIDDLVRLGKIDINDLSIETVRANQEIPWDKFQALDDEVLWDIIRDYKRRRKFYKESAVSEAGRPHSMRGGRTMADLDREASMREKDPRSMSKKDFVRSVKDKGKVPNLKGDMGPLAGMEGPFQFKSGAVLYYDTKTGEYYDRGKDMYLDRDEAAQLTMENKKMNLEEIVRQAVRTALKEKKYRREDKEPIVMKEGDFVGHHVEIDGKTYVDSDFLNSVRKIRDTFPSELKSMGFGEFYLETPKGRIDFDRSRGKTFPGAVGRGHLLRSDPPELADELLSAMEQAGASETPLPAEEPPPDLSMENKKMNLEEIVRQAVRTALKEKKYRREDEDEDEEGEEVNETLREAPDQNVEIIGSLVNQHGFMNARESLEQAGFKVDFVTSPLPMYILEKDGVKYAALNKKYAEDPDLVVGETAIGVMNEELSAKQKKLDLDDDGNIDPEDLKGLRAGKKDEDVGKEKDKNEALDPRNPLTKPGMRMAEPGDPGYGEGGGFEPGDRVQDDRNGDIGTVVEPLTEPAEGGAVIELESGETVRIRGKFLSKLDENTNKEWYDSKLFESLMQKWAK